MNAEAKDKRALKREYLETRTRAGVYAIRHLASGRLLVAGSKDAQAALNRHLFELRMKMHRQRQLQRDWAEHGEAGFVFEVLDRVTPRDEADFDPGRELETLTAMWREQLGLGEAGDYAVPGPRA
jgi:hypothetical protein